MGSGQGCKEEVLQMEGRHFDNYSFAFADNSTDDNQDADWHHNRDNKATATVTVMGLGRLHLQL